LSDYGIQRALPYDNGSFPGFSGLAIDGKPGPEVKDLDEF
jgi:hypothetical protein